MQQKTKTFLKNWIILSIVLNLILMLSLYIFIPAYHSVNLACFSNFSEEEIKESELVGGYFWYNDSNPENCQIVIRTEENTTEYRKTFAHEYTHYLQYQAGILADCNHPIKMFINEGESYLVGLLTW